MHRNVSISFVRIETGLCQKHENKGLSLLKLGTAHNIPHLLTITGPQGIFGPDNPSEAQLRMIDTLSSLKIVFTIGFQTSA